MPLGQSVGPLQPPLPVLVVAAPEPPPPALVAAPDPFPPVLVAAPDPPSPAPAPEPLSPPPAGDPELDPLDWLSPKSRTSALQAEPNEIAATPNASQPAHREAM